jgi:maltose O-acetyltransferase
MKEPTEGEYLQRSTKWLNPLYLWPLKILHCVGGVTAVAHAIEYLPLPVPALRAFGANVGADTIVYPRLTIHGAQRDFSNLCIGNGVRILRNCFLDLTERIDIGHAAILSNGCNLITHQNIYRSPLASVYPPAREPIVLKPGAVLFANVTVLMGVTIGECAMVAAGAVVTADVPDWTLVAGVPARPVKSLR